MNYLRIKNGNIEYPYTISQLRIDEYNISFPSNLTDAILEQFGVYTVIQTPKPNDYTKNITEGIPTLTDGVYYQNWESVDATESEIEDRITQKWTEIREHRNDLLKECDWRVLPDSPVGDTLSDWNTYRQELRNITSQENPFSIVWPAEP
jgi:uncharacterized membrane protein YcaP (DUF421 family)